jgi:hypothetical protein
MSIVKHFLAHREQIFFLDSSRLDLRSCGATPGTPAGSGARPVSAVHQSLLRLLSALSALSAALSVSLCVPLHHTFIVPDYNLRKFDVPRIMKIYSPGIWIVGLKKYKQKRADLLYILKLPVQ